MSDDHESDGTEPGLGPWPDPGEEQSLDLELSFARHLDDEEVHLSKDRLTEAASGLPPDGKATGTIGVKVTDQNGKPVKGVRVNFSGVMASRSGVMRLARSGLGTRRAA